MSALFQEKYDFIAADITSNCNLRCPFCLNDFTQITVNTLMEETTFKKVLTLLPLVKDDGFFFFSCLFEPLLHPKFFKLLRLIPEQERKKVFFTTNLAKKLSDESIYELSASQIHHINISLDSLIPSPFESLRKGARFERFFDNLERLVKVFAQNQFAPRLHYITVLCKANLDEVDKLLQVTAEKYLAKEHEFRCFIPFGFIDSTWLHSNSISEAEWKAVKEKLASSPYQYVLGDFISYEHLPDHTIYSEYEKKVYSYPPCLSLIISASGIVKLLHMPIDISIDIHDISNPYSVFKEILSLHALDIERGKELAKVTKASPEKIRAGWFKIKPERA